MDGAAHVASELSDEEGVLLSAPGDPSIPLATFTLGRVLLDRVPALVVQHFEQALEGRSGSERRPLGTRGLVPEARACDRGRHGRRRRPRRAIR